MVPRCPLDPGTHDVELLRESEAGEGTERRAGPRVRTEPGARRDGGSCLPASTAHSTRGEEPTAGVLLAETGRLLRKVGPWLVAPGSLSFRPPG